MSSLILGRADDDEAAGIRNGEISVPYKAREAHMHVIGRTRSGKSRFLFDCIKQDINAGYGICLLDPHGELCDLVLNWLTREKTFFGLRENVHYVRFTDPDTTFRFNPLAVHDESQLYTASSKVVEAITRIFGGDSSTETPLFADTLDIAATIAAMNRLPLAAVPYFLQDTKAARKVRDQLCRSISDQYFKARGLAFNEKTPKEFRETVGSTERRVHAFLRNPVLRRLFSTTENTVDLRQAMDEGHIFLFDLSPRDGVLNNQELASIGSLFVNNLFRVAEQRKERDNPHPFMLYLDEAQLFVNNDIEDILSQAGKRKLFLTLSHQFLEQLAFAGPKVYHGVMAGCLIKTVFQCSFADADAFVDEMFADRIDFERVKEKLAIPHTVGHEIGILQGTSHATTVTGSNTWADGRAWGQTESHSDAAVDGHVSGSGSGAGDTSGLGATFLTPDGFELLALPHATTESATASLVRNQYEAKSRSRMAGHGKATSSVRQRVVGGGDARGEVFGTTKSETLIPIYQWFSTHTEPLEEQRFGWKRALSHQPERHAYMAIRRTGARGFTTRHVPDALDIRELEADTIKEIRDKSPWISRKGEVRLVEDLPAFKALLPATDADGFLPEPEEGYGQAKKKKSS